MVMQVYSSVYSHAVEVRGIHHRAIHSFRASRQVKNFGIGQNTGETLLKFRQKSKENLKEFETRRVKRSFVPDIRQVSDTHRTWPEFQSGNWVGSCHITLIHLGFILLYKK
ncbi:pyrimidine 2 [Prunus dulcis]|uniref:Pyrimidine 2 n=1 Tax=Prunus dulcis TaxID=3755 RepID=A0A5H2XM31_PRUDU|nr:pyrimidine 2 [Prunus dulcis]